MARNSLGPTRYTRDPYQLPGVVEVGMGSNVPLSETGFLLEVKVDGQEPMPGQPIADRDPIGQRVAWTGDVLRFIPVSGDWRTVVGNTKDEGLDAEPRPVLYGSEPPDAREHP